MSVSIPRFLYVSCLLGFLLPMGCVEVSQMAAPERGLLGQAVSDAAESEEEPEQVLPFVGVTLEESIGSLDAMDFVVGLEVVRVDKGSPSAEVGVRVGDRVVEVNDVELLSLDQWQAVLDSLSEESWLRLVIERDGRALSEVTIGFETVRTEELPSPVRFVERWKVRAEFETVAVDDAVFVLLRRIYRGSPLAESGMRAGDWVVALDGIEVTSADSLVRLLEARDFGEEVTFKYVQLFERGDPEMPDERVARAKTLEARLALWSPPRYLTRLQVPLLFDYEHDPVRDELSFSFLDFWLFAIYDYRREAESRRHRLLYFFEYSSGVGELSDETRSDDEVLGVDGAWDAEGGA